MTEPRDPNAAKLLRGRLDSLVFHKLLRSNPRSDDEKGNTKPLVLTRYKWRIAGFLHTNIRTLFVIWRAQSSKLWKRQAYLDRHLYQLTVRPIWVFGSKWRVILVFRLRLKKLGKVLLKVVCPLERLWSLQTVRFWVKVTTCAFNRAVLRFMYVWKYLQYIASIDVEELIENIGWDFGSGECWTPTCLSLHGFNHVHNPLTMRYVFWSLFTVQG